MTTQTVYIVRHGQTLLNTFNRMQGWCDSDLTKQGQTDAITTGQKLKKILFTTAFSSDLRRAIDTRNLILDQLDHKVSTIEESKLFREVFFGYFEGLDSDETWTRVGQPHGYAGQEDIIRKKSLAEARRLMKLEDPSQSAETNDQVLNRWHEGLSFIHENTPDNSNVLLVTHGTFIRTLADEHDINTLGNYPENGSITILKLTDAGTSIELYNQNSI
ncbi:histidine phosphatase family protein [Paucilactobacillus sp. N302-9]